MNHIIRLTISAPTDTANALYPLACLLTSAIGKVCEDQGVTVLMDLNINAASPKSFAKNWDKRQREIAEESR